MLKTRKKSISIMIVMAFLLSMMIPAAAFGADAVTFTNAIKTGVVDGAANALGWVKIDIDQDQYPDGSQFYVTVTLPEGIDYKNDPSGGVTLSDYVVGVNEDDSNIAPSLVGTPDEDELTVKIVDLNTKVLDYILVNFADATVGAGSSEVNVEDDYDQDIVVNVSVNAVDANDNNLWTSAYEKDATVGQMGDNEVTFSGKTPKAVTVGTAKECAKIVISESQAGALANLAPEIYLELADDDNFEITAVAVTAGDYGLTCGSSAINAAGDKVTLKTFGPSSPFADELEVKLTISVFPGASGDVEIECSGNDDDVVDATITVATLGDTEVEVTTDGDADDIYVADSTGLAIEDLEFEGNSNFADDETIILALPEGFEWDAQPGIVGLTSQGIFNDNRSMWYEVSALNDDEVTIDGLKIDVAADAPAGDITVDITGSLVEDSVVVGECQDRAEFTVEQPEIKVGFGALAGDITIVETVKDSLSDGDDIILDLPSGVEWAADPTVEVNDDEKNWAIATNADGDQLTLTINNMRSQKIDTIVLTDVKYDLDNRVAFGDITVKVKGDAFNKIAVGAEVNDTDSDDAVMTFSNAIVVSDTAAEVQLTIGDSAMVVNGEEQAIDVAPYIKDSRTFLPLRYAANAVGVDDSNIMWDGVAKKATILKGDRVVQFTIGSNVMLLNGATINMDVAPEITNGRTMIPVRYISQALGADLSWDDATKTVTIDVD